ncbi:hypothetical protein [Aeromicrobium sp.]|uniref:hypothetical protein n=1 Tax=Aeromicrobium sp. TaxID=1871063 RepID=UPI0030ECC8CE
MGSAIGAIAGLAFVLINAGNVPAPLLWCLVASSGFIAILWFVVLRGPEVAQVSPSRSAVRTYGISVAVMVVAIPLGASVITNALDRPNAVLAWVVFVVGVHFLPFAHEFHLPVFRWLSASLVVVSLVGAVLALSSDGAVAAGWTGVAAGFTLLLFSAVGPSLARETTAPST